MKISILKKKSYNNDYYEDFKIMAIKNLLNLQLSLFFP